MRNMLDLEDLKSFIQAQRIEPRIYAGNFTSVGHLLTLSVQLTDPIAFVLEAKGERPVTFNSAEAAIEAFNTRVRWTREDLAYMKAQLEEGSNE